MLNMKVLRYIYRAALVITALAVIWGIQLSISLNNSMIRHQQEGTWDVSMSGAGMAVLGPVILAATSYAIANALGVIVLFLNRKRQLLKGWEKKLIIVNLLLIGGYLVWVLLSYALGIAG